MQRNYLHLADLIDVGIGPWTRRKIGDSTNVKVDSKRDLSSQARLDRLTGQSEDHLIYELGACQPVQVCDSPQYRRRKRQIVIQETADSGAMKRVIAQGLSQGSSNQSAPNDQDLARFCFTTVPLPEPLACLARQQEPSQAAGEYCQGSE